LSGPNGCGKSTALLAIAGRLPISAGSIVWHDGTVDPHPSGRPTYGLLLQGGRVFPSMTVRENLQIAGMALPRQLLGDSMGRMMDEIPKLEPLLDKRGGVMSGGERQVAALAMTLIREPEVLLLDEPFAGVDEVNANDFVMLLTRIKRRKNTGMLIVEHRLEWV